MEVVSWSTNTYSSYSETVKSVTQLEMRTVCLQSKICSLWNMLAALLKHTFHFEGEPLFWFASHFFITTGLVVGKYGQTHMKNYKQPMQTGFWCSTFFATDFTQWQQAIYMNHCQATSDCTMFYMLLPQKLTVMNLIWSDFNLIWLMAPPLNLT